MSILSNAFDRTRHQLGGWRSVILLAATGFVSLGVHGVMWGFADMLAEWQPYTSAVIGWFAAATVLFVYNVFSAPYRLEKEHGDKLARRNSELRAEIETHADRLKEAQDEIAALKRHAPDLVLEVIEVNGSEKRGRVEILMILQVSNRGDRPSGTTNWKMELVLPGEPKFEVPIAYAQGEFEITSASGRGFKLDGEQMMPRKAAKPIAPGQIIQGVVIGTPPARPGLNARLEGCKIQIGFLDVHGRRTIVAVDVVSAEYGGGPTYSPLLDVKWYERKEGE